MTMILKDVNIRYGDGSKYRTNDACYVMSPRSPIQSIRKGGKSPELSGRGFETPLSCDMQVRFLESLCGEKDHYDNRRRPSTTGSISIEKLTPEGRLSRSLKRWMPGYVLRSLPPQAHPPRQPLFSARFEDVGRIRKSESCESLDTQLSLLSCSSNDTQPVVQPKGKRRRKKKTLEQNNEDEANNWQKSIWVQLANKTSGELDKMLKKHAMYAMLDTEGEIFRNLDTEHQEMVTYAGSSRGQRLGPGRQRSDSTSNTKKKLPPKKKIQRSSSVGDLHEGPLINFMELRRQLISQKLSMQNKSRYSGRRSLNRSSSRVSLMSTASSDVLNSHTPGEGMSPIPMADDVQDTPISVWKGDSQILAIDLRRELTAKVRSKITSTTTALDRVTGYGEDNESKFFVGTLEEYPYLIEDDYSHIAKVPQRVRISPHLSHVIRTDIHVRMGRPRYHEIRINDIKMWDRGQLLDRSHRNLKVFNWLHSLRESEFDYTLPGDIEDVPPGGDVTTRDEAIIAVDEPKVKPLLERLKTEYIV